MISVDGEWSDWTPWSTCTATCGGGTRKKNRTCSEPKYGGKYCDGEEAETDMCNVDPCPGNNSALSKVIIARPMKFQLI